MSNIGEDQPDTTFDPSGVAEIPEPASMERKRPAWMMIAILAAVALVALLVILAVIPNGAVSP